MRAIVLREDPTQLVVQPTDAEVAAFGHGSAVTVMAAPAMTALDRLQDAMGHGVLYDRYGLPIAQVTNMTLETERLDVTSWQDTHRRYLPGRRSCRIEAYAINL